MIMDSFPSRMSLRFLFVIGVLLLGILTTYYTTPQKAFAITNSDVRVIDMFNRTINDYRVELVDWEGYIANPFIKLTVKPPIAANSYPVTVTIHAQGTSRLAMDLPSQLSATGATKTLTFANANEEKQFKLVIHPDRIGGPNQIENYTLAFTVVQNNGSTHSHSIPIRVWDQDDNQAESLPVVIDYRYDTITNYFSNSAIRAANELAIRDWFYFMNTAPFDTVASGAETSNIPNDNFSGHTIGSNNAPYNGMWVFVRGINDPHSTGYASSNGNYHKRNGVNVPGSIHRSIGAILDFFPNFTAFTSVNDEEAYLAQNDSSTCTSNCKTDIYSVMSHEFGHGFAYSGAWSGVAAYKNSGGNDAGIIAYQGAAVPIDNGYHIPGEQPYWDRLSGQNGGRNHTFPTQRWMLTKLSLLVAEKAGWTLDRTLTPFLDTSIETASLPGGTKGQAYNQILSAKGGVPFYDWTISNGSLPAGLTLDRFTGQISGTISNQANNSYTFTVQLRDYDELRSPISKTFTITTDGSTPSELVVHYLFNETSGTTAADASGNGRNGTLNGGASWATGQFGNAVSLNGSNGYVSAPSGIVSSLNDFTFASWVNVSSVINWARIFDFGTGTSSYMFLSPQAGGAGLRFAITTSGSGGEQQLTSPALGTGWKHVAVTLSGTTGRLYINGVQAASNTSMTLKPSNLGNTSNNYIGRSQFADPYLNGAVDDFRIYNRALSTLEISTLAGGSSTPTDKAPQATASASFVSTWESLAGLNDGYTPTSSNDRGHPIYGNWDNPNTTQWVQYDFSQNYTLSRVDVYWFDDNGGIDLPASYTIQYWNGTAWANVGSPSGLGLSANQYNTTTFTPVSTNRIRMNITAKATTSTGLESWMVFGS